MKKDNTIRARTDAGPGIGDPEKCRDCTERKLASKRCDECGELVCTPDRRDKDMCVFHYVRHNGSPVCWDCYYG